MRAFIAGLAACLFFISTATAEPKRRSVASHRLPTDCPGIQEAIDRLPAGGGEVRLLPMTYACSEPIVIARNDVVLRGTGPATVLRLADHANAPVIVIGETAAVPSTTYRRISVLDLTIDGNRAAQDFECLRGECSASNALRNNGITLRRVEDVLVQGIRVRSPRSGGLVTELIVRRATIRDLTVEDSFFDGVAGYETEDSVFDGLYLHDNLAAGLSFDIAFNHNVVSNTVITRSGKVGIFMRDARDNLFEALQIRESGEHGIFLAQVDGEADKPAAGNTFAGLVVESSDGAGVRVNDASCTDNLVVGAQLIANRDGGVSEATPGLLKSAGVIVR